MWNPVDKIRTTYQETITELRKCTWPSRDELKESTLVVISSVVLLSVFVFVVDNAAQALVRFLTSSW